MEHESQSDWKQLGSLANGILRSVAEKRMKQAEFLAAEERSFKATKPIPQAVIRGQLDLPLLLPGAPSAQIVGASRH